MVVQFDSSQCYKAGDSTLSWIREISRKDVTPAYVLGRLAASSDSELRIAVADHVSTSEETLLLLADDENADVRYAIAENHNISRKVLDKLKDDPNPHIAHRAQTSLARLDIDDHPSLTCPPQN